jgi:hypothetical protein
MENGGVLFVAVLYVVHIEFKGTLKEKLRTGEIDLGEIDLFGFQIKLGALRTQYPRTENGEKS